MVNRWFSVTEILFLQEDSVKKSMQHRNVYIKFNSLGFWMRWWKNYVKIGGCGSAKRVGCLLNTELQQDVEPQIAPDDQILHALVGGRVCKLGESNLTIKCCDLTKRCHHFRWWHPLCWVFCLFIDRLSLYKYGETLFGTSQQVPRYDLKHKKLYYKRTKQDVT